ncbi:28289_t:CDS:2 [Gigaspora margarita]|uniref:28289_t:CDS:1 n=1 Tax=Gigaspora margarita TaxID=4874 RepID=A0ABM8W751_GIGMA|nr:28289_t:CDS:2 [Gigaspora margarita]
MNESAKEIKVEKNYSNNLDNCYQNRVRNKINKDEAFSYLKAISNRDKFQKMINLNKENEEQNKKKYSEQPAITTVQAIIVKKTTKLILSKQ